ncbi:cobalamin B12-binding domain-containing protein [Kutzneria kofuensis]|uniref:Methylaspartate mutase sigma subunit n=1 Tax=Kutzneria kofuensis TaxID=103725 RepID=A0A7W9NIY3_9PSEU|nr:cobalamin-dependent protein [Kutzneria kofuensis]MBB5895102.1 methylaspartate mutase sigma subunit [Kutzneria kofuensis]
MTMQIFADNTLTGSRGTVVVSGVASDAHTWNLVFLQLMIEELGYDVVNLGPCVSPELLVAECEQHKPALVVISSVNGHGYQDGLRLIDEIRGSSELVATPVVIGGKLGVAGELDEGAAARLMSAGFDAVFEDGAKTVVSFYDFMAALPSAATPLPGRTRVAV